MRDGNSISCLNRRWRPTDQITSKYAYLYGTDVEAPMFDQMLTSWFAGLQRVHPTVLKGMLMLLHHDKIDRNAAMNTDNK